MVYRPWRIGDQGETERHTIREVGTLVDAIRAGSAPDEETGRTHHGEPSKRVFSAFVRRAIRTELRSLGWDLDILLHGDSDAVDFHFVEMTGDPRPRKGRKPNASPGGTGELF